MPVTGTNGRARSLTIQRKISPVLSGVSLTRDESKASYAIIRHNIRTYESGGVVLVIRGKENAEIRVKHFETGQRSDLKAGMDPAEATNLRQMKLEMRESQAVPDQMPLANPPRQN